VFEVWGHTQIFTSIHLSLKKFFASYPAVHSDGTSQCEQLGKKESQKSGSKEKLQFGESLTCW